ncbi:MAG: SDR family oxidoreductase [Candidatus Alcyoniella australis]|nr:SDR family oxidoreductase [Candidatus Alcyoniella australis]
MKKLKDKVVLITGGAHGIGLCTAEYFAKAGSVLVLTDIDEPGLDAAAKQIEELGAKVHTYVTDVSKKSAVDKTAKDVIAKLGGVDVLINNAGIGHNGEIKDTTLKQWRKLIDVNFMGPLHFIYALLPSMIERNSGHIVNLSSGQAFFLLPTWGAYASIKLGMAGYSEVLGFELSKHNIEVTTVYPFMVNTGFYDEVQGETWGAKMSMKLLPFYSNSPKTVGRIIFKAVRKDKAVEMVSPINLLGFYSRFLPLLHSGVNTVASMLLAKRD